MSSVHILQNHQCGQYETTRRETGVYWLDLLRKSAQLSSEATRQHLEKHATPDEASTRSLTTFPQSCLTIVVQQSAADSGSWSASRRSIHIIEVPWVLVERYVDDAVSSTMFFDVPSSIHTSYCNWSAACVFHQHLNAVHNRSVLTDDGSRCAHYFVQHNRLRRFSSTSAFISHKLHTDAPISLQMLQIYF